MLIKPSLDEIKLRAAKIGLPELEAEKFEAYYGANGWKVGRTPMVDWTKALALWLIKWRQEHQGKNGNGHGSFWENQKRLELVQKEIDDILRISPRTAWGTKVPAEHLERYRKLVAEKKRLKEALGLV